MGKRMCQSCGEKILIASTDDPNICAECGHVPEVASAIAIIGKVIEDEAKKFLPEKPNWNAIAA